jgi:hypothetical protein
MGNAGRAMGSGNQSNRVGGWDGSGMMDGEMSLERQMKYLFCTSDLCFFLLMPLAPDFCYSFGFF